MGVQQFYPTVRTELIERLNHVPYAKVASSFAASLPPLNAATFGNASLAYSTATPLIGGNTGQLIQGAAGANIGAVLLEKTLSDLQLGANTTYTVSLYVKSEVGSANPQLLVQGDGVTAGTAGRSAVDGTKGQWIRISKTITTSAAGTVSVYLFWDSNGFQDNYCLFDALQIDDGGAAQPWFDGGGPLVADPDHMYGWLGAAGASLSKQYIFDPTEVFRPTLVLGWGSTKTVGRVVHRTLNNTLVVVERQNTQYRGTISTLWADRASAYRFYSFLDRLGTSFKYEDYDNPENGMTFVPTNEISIQQSENRLRWQVDIPFEQVA